MGFFKSIKNFINAFIRGGRGNTNKPKSSTADGMATEIEKNRAC